MGDERTSAAVQRYLDELAGDSPAEPVVRALLDRACPSASPVVYNALVSELSAALTRPPLNLEADEMLSAVVERLLKALRQARPRQYVSSSDWPASTWAPGK